MFIEIVPTEFTFPVTDMNRLPEKWQTETQPDGLLLGTDHLVYVGTAAVGYVLRQHGGLSDLGSMTSLREPLNEELDDELDRREVPDVDCGLARIGAALVELSYVLQQHRGAFVASHGARSANLTAGRNQRRVVDMSLRTRYSTGDQRQTNLEVVSRDINSSVADRQLHVAVGSRGDKHKLQVVHIGFDQDAFLQHVVDPSAAVFSSDWVDLLRSTKPSSEAA